jgi:hypothetical protein
VGRALRRHEAEAAGLRELSEAAERRVAELEARLEDEEGLRAARVVGDAEAEAARIIADAEAEAARMTTDAEERGAAVLVAATKEAEGRRAEARRRQDGLRGAAAHPDDIAYLEALAAAGGEPARSEPARSEPLSPSSRPPFIQTPPPEDDLEIVVDLTDAALAAAGELEEEPAVVGRSQTFYERRLSGLRRRIEEQGGRPRR